MTDVLLIERADGVATLTLNRPESMNSLSVELKEALLDAVREVAADPSGAGGRAHRCRPRDSASARTCASTSSCSSRGDPTPLYARSPSTTTRSCSRSAEMPKPVIAAVNGMAAGAGRRAGVRLRLPHRQPARRGSCMAFANVGLTLDSGASWTLPRLVGSARATALALLAEPISAEAALEMGLVNAVVEPERVLPAAPELAARLAAGPTAAYAAIKAVDRATRGHRTLADGAGQGGRAADGDAGRPRTTATRPPRSSPSRSRPSPAAEHVRLAVTVRAPAARRRGRRPCRSPASGRRQWSGRRTGSRAA